MPRYHVHPDVIIEYGVTSVDGCTDDGCELDHAYVLDAQQLASYIIDHIVELSRYVDDELPDLEGVTLYNRESDRTIHIVGHDGECPDDDVHSDERHEAVPATPGDGQPLDGHDPGSGSDADPGGGSDPFGEAVTCPGCGAHPTTVNGVYMTIHEVRCLWLSDPESEPYDDRLTIREQ